MVTTNTKNNSINVMNGNKTLNTFGIWYKSLSRFEKPVYFEKLHQLCNSPLFFQNYDNVIQNLTVTAIYVNMSNLKLIYYLAAIQCGFRLDLLDTKSSNNLPTETELANQLNLSKA